MILISVIVILISNCIGICKILSTFIQYTSVMADRGFKSLAELLQIVNVKLLRQLSKLPSEIMINENVIETKRIASLKIHVKRSIGRK